MDFLTQANLTKSWQDTMILQENYYNVQGFTQIIREANYWQNSEIKYSYFSNGIELKLLDKNIYRSYGEKAEHFDYPYLVSHFVLSGEQGVISPDIKNIKPEYTEKGGESYLLFLPDMEEIEQYNKEQNFQVIIIRIPLFFIQNIFSTSKQLPKRLKSLIESDFPSRFHQPVGKVTPMMKTVMKQIWQHPYQGAIAQLYLEAKVLELVSLQLSELLAQEKKQTSPYKLKVSEIEKVYEAQKFLQQSYLDPPSIEDLAQKIELDRIKLQEGFREIFQVTPFQYLQNYRLDLARVLLEEKKLTVSNVAHRIGYSNVSYFSYAFKRRYGMTPGQYRHRFSFYNC